MIDYSLLLLAIVFELFAIAMFLARIGSLLRDKL